MRGVVQQGSGSREQERNSQNVRTGERKYQVVYMSAWVSPCGQHGCDDPSWSGCYGLFTAGSCWCARLS
jgi:hypothetical protein